MSTDTGCVATPELEAFAKRVARRASCLRMTTPVNLRQGHAVPKLDHRSHYHHLKKFPADVLERVVDHVDGDIVQSSVSFRQGCVT